MPLEGGREGGREGVREGGREGRKGGEGKGGREDIPLIFTGMVPTTATQFSRLPLA